MGEGRREDMSECCGEILIGEDIYWIYRGSERRKGGYCE